MLTKCSLNLGRPLLNLVKCQLYKHGELKQRLSGEFGEKKKWQPSNEIIEFIKRYAFKMKPAGVPCSLIAVICTVTIEWCLGAIYYIAMSTSCDGVWKTVCHLSSGLECDENLDHLSLPDRGIAWEALYKQGDSMSGSKIRSKQESQQRPRSPSTQTVASLADQTSSQSALSTDWKNNNCHCWSLPSYG